MSLFRIEKGKAKFYGIRFGKDLTGILTRALKKEKNNSKIKVAIAYGDNPKESLNLKEKLEKEEKIKVLFVSRASPAVGVYTGQEVLIVGICPA